MINEIYDTTGLERTMSDKDQISRVPLAFTTATVRRVAAASRDSTIATIEVWPQLTAEELAELMWPSARN